MRIQFDDSFFLPEERDGFYIKSMMKRYWASNMECLVELDRICRENNIKYFAAYGTLLGAVRHKGYIPWDDDIDIAMLREDYEKFIKCCEYALVPPFELFNAKGSMLCPMRLISTPKTTLEERFLMEFHLCPYSTGVDIYVLDKLPYKPDDVEMYKLNLGFIQLFAQRTDINFQDFSAMAGIHEEPFTQADIDENIAFTEQQFKVKIDRNKPLAPQLSMLTHKCMATYSKSAATKVANVQSWLSGYSPELNLSDFEPIYLPFENIEIACPKGYERILTKIYGDDYMTPKQGYGRSHGNYPAYKDREEELFKFLTENGITIPQFLQQ